MRVVTKAPVPRAGSLFRSFDPDRRCLDEFALAAGIGGVFDKLSDRIGYEMPAIQRDRLLELRDKVRTSLGPERFQEEWTSGQSMSFDESIELARELVSGEASV
jgi:hypothetical protein